VAIVTSPPVQAVLRNRIRAGMSRFSKTMRREWQGVRRAAGLRPGVGLPGVGCSGSDSESESDTTPYSVRSDTD